jgi:hypothetical protein
VNLENGCNQFAKISDFCRTNSAYPILECVRRS